MTKFIKRNLFALGVPDTPQIGERDTTMFKLGTSGDFHECECCGKTGLKKTVVLSDRDGNIRHYGVDCAERALNPLIAILEARMNAKRTASK